MDTYRCCTCKEDLPPDAFYKAAGRRKGQCKKCQSEYSKGWYQKNRERHLAQNRRNRLRREFGLSEDEYEEMLAAQGGTCAICDSTVGYSGKRLAVDHCHNSGAIRGILCDRCNQILGLAKDDPNLLAKCAEYISSRIFD